MVFFSDYSFSSLRYLCFKQPFFAFLFVFSHSVYILLLIACLVKVVADGSCQNWYTQGGNQLAYSLTCDGDNYRGTMGLSCDNQNYTFTGDDKTCHWTDEFGGVGLSIDCRYGISNGGIVAMVLACILFPIFCCWVCTLDEYDEECCPGCGPRVKVRRRTKNRKVAPVVPMAEPVESTAVAEGAEDDATEEPEKKKVRAAVLFVSKDVF